MSTQFLTDPKIERLGDKHGPAAVSVVVALLSQAMLQEKGGIVERTFRTLANESFSDREVVAEIISDAAETGLLTIEKQDDLGVTVCFPAWKRHQATGRKAKEREARKPAPQANVTDCRAPSQKVTHKTGQDSTEQGTAKSAKAPTPNRVVFDAWVESTGKDLARTKLDPKRQRVIRDALKAYPLEDVIDAVRGWKHSPHHRGENERRTKYNSLAVLLRDAEQIEQFRDLTRGQAPRRPLTAEEMP